MKCDICGDNITMLSHYSVIHEFEYVDLVHAKSMNEYHICGDCRKIIMKHITELKKGHESEV